MKSSGGSSEQFSILQVPNALLIRVTHVREWNLVCEKCEMVEGETFLFLLPPKFSQRAK